MNLTKTVSKLSHEDLMALSVMGVGTDEGMVPYVIQAKARTLGGPGASDPTYSSEPVEQVCTLLIQGLDQGLVRVDDIADRPGYRIPVWSLTPEGQAAVLEEQDRRCQHFNNPEDAHPSEGLVHPRYGHIVFRAHPATIHVISLGAGVQSTAVALMAAEGIIARPDCAIFSDTQWEPGAVYGHLEWLEGVLPFEVQRVTAGDICQDMMDSARHGTRWAGPPLFTVDENGKWGQLRRFCTREYKLEPIRKRIRELMGLKRYQHVGNRRVEQWLGISTDEARRAKPATESWVSIRWPLLELDISRQGCLDWMRRSGYPTPPRSSCIGCPYHSDAEWLQMKTHRPYEWEEAVQADELVRDGVAGTTTRLFVHVSRQPLADVELEPECDYDPNDVPDCGCAEEISDIWE